MWYNFKDTQKIMNGLKFYRVMAVPTLLYGSEVWTITNNYCKRSQAPEMKFFGLMVGYTSRAGKRNDIRKEFSIFSIN